MKITATLKALPFLSILTASLMLMPGLSMAGEQSRAQHRSQSVQHSNNPAMQRHNNRSYNKHGAVKPHYRARSYDHPVYRAHAYAPPVYLAPTHPPAYIPAPHVPSIALGLHATNVTLTLGH